MGTGSSSNDDKLQRAVEIFLESAQTLADSPDQLAAAVKFGLERVFDELVREACREVGLAADAFSAALAAEPPLQTMVQERLAELFSPDALSSARGQTVRKEAERHLQVLRYVLSGQEPAQWVWNAMDRPEQTRLRAYRAAGGDDDELMLARVHRALDKVGEGRFGKCEDCGRDVSPERLSLVPYAERCTACQLRQEQPPPPAGSAESDRPARVQVRMFFEAGQPVDPEDAVR